MLAPDAALPQALTLARARGPAFAQVAPLWNARPTPRCTPLEGLFFPVLHYTTPQRLDPS